MREEILTSLDMRISPHHVLCQNHHTAALDESELDCTGRIPDVYAAESPCQAGPDVRSTDLMLMVTERRG